jgi:chromosome segregation ATPase
VALLWEYDRQFKEAANDLSAVQEERRRQREVHKANLKGARDKQQALAEGLATLVSARRTEKVQFEKRLSDSEANSDNLPTGIAQTSQQLDSEKGAHVSDVTKLVYGSNKLKKLATALENTHKQDLEQREPSATSRYCNTKTIFGKLQKSK